jgi:hypothetical protein
LSCNSCYDLTNKQKQDQVNCENPNWEKFISEKYSPKKIFTLENIHPKKYSPQKYQPPEKYSPYKYSPFENIHP